MVNATIRPKTASIAVCLMAIEAEHQGADANDSNGIVRRLVADSLPGRPDAQFSLWFSICCELADMAARRQGFEGQADRAEVCMKGVI